MLLCIHIHWALPEAFTHGSQNEAGQLTFPPVCNRWLISRIIISNSGELNPKSWIIESDALAEEQPPAGQQRITLPVHQVNNKKDYRYVGNNTAFTCLMARNYSLRPI